MKAIIVVVLAMSALRAVWEPPAEPAIKKTRGWVKRVEMEQSQTRRERSPRRRCGVKAMLKSWAKGEISTVGIWRLCHAIVTGDGTDAGYGMDRLANLGSGSSGSEQNCSRRMKEILSDTNLPKMVQAVPHAKGENTVTHTLPPTELIRLIHTHNRAKFGQVFSADPVALRKFWRSLFASEDGREFQQLHPGLRNKSPEDLQTSIPIVIHEDAAPYGKKRSVHVFQWPPLLINGSDIESRYVHHGYISKAGEPAETARRAWERFWEEADLMIDGRHRPRRHHVDIHVPILRERFRHGC